MYRLGTVHARDNQPTTNDQRRHDTAYLNKRLFTKVRRLKIHTNSSWRIDKYYVQLQNRTVLTKYIGIPCWSDFEVLGLKAEARDLRSDNN